MNTQEIKNQIEQSAKEINCTELEIITSMQGVCAKNGEEKMLSILCNIKQEYASASIEEILNR